MTCGLANCVEIHVTNPSNGQCVDRDSSLGRMIVRNLDEKPQKIKVESSFPAYADKAVRENVTNLTRRVNDIGDSLQLMGKKIDDMAKLDDIKDVRTALDSYATTYTEIRKALEMVAALAQKVEQHEAETKQIAAAVENFSKDAVQAVNDAKKVAELNELDLKDIKEENAKAVRKMAQIEEELTRANALIAIIEKNTVAGVAEKAYNQFNSLATDRTKEITELTEKAAEYVKEVVDESQKNVEEKLKIVEKQAEKCADVIKDAEKHLSDGVLQIERQLESTIMQQASDVRSQISQASKISQQLEPERKQNVQDIEYVDEADKQEEIAALERNLEIEKRQAESDYNAAIELQSRAAQSVANYNAAVAQGQAIDRDIARFENENARNTTEKGLDMLAQAHAASDRNRAIIDETRSHVSDMSSKYQKAASLANEELAIVKKDEAKVKALRVQEQVRRENERDLNASALTGDLSSLDKQRVFSDSMKALMKRGLKPDSEEYIRVMSEVRANLKKGQVVTVESLIRV
jgi:hypothetical protein